MALDLKSDFDLPDGAACQLRNFDDSHLQAILALEKRSNPHPWSERNFQDSIANSHICIGVQTNEEWVALAVFSIASGDAELLIISVDPLWQGRGVASRMLELMGEVLEDFAAELFLEVRASNEAAIHLYDKCGFNCLGVRPAYYPADRGREDAHIYGKSLRIG
ncbi:ribosomal protein S18-alanine N-acetyltransferase [Teredinibacter haidensis]|uniref:ribosomal protein S18-alanine N-acetyltransferase n=1 Tax=Teredinibacter haidensis TaxID=2731755 RepID=UPI000948B9D0|nr:ribosomal protein S18-alanine N-acetyltransferase [Teredinibacter haidensis]